MTGETKPTLLGIFLRFLRFGLLAWGGPRMEALLHRYVDRIGWATVALIVLLAILMVF